MTVKHDPEPFIMVQQCEAVNMNMIGRYTAAIIVTVRHTLAPSLGLGVGL